MKHTLQEMNISHVTTSYYHPQGNSKLVQFHQTLHDAMSKKVSDIILEHYLEHLPKSGTSCHLVKYQ